MNRLVIWGGTSGLESHRHIHRTFFNTARKLGIPARWVADSPESASELTPGTTVISANIYGHHLPSRNGVRYVLHNFSGDSTLCRSLDESQIIRLQVWTTEASGEKWDECRSYDREARTLFQPWGTDLFAEEFLDPVFNSLSTDATFVGAIWGENSPYGELGNVSAIEELKEAVASFGLRFRHLTHISDEDNITAIRSARIAPAIAGEWQVNHGYLPCRVFKNASYGAATFCNVPEVQRLFGPAMVGGDSLSKLVENTLRLKQREYLELVREQQRIVARYTYRQSLEAIERAFDEHV